jgi:hypothetical protein
MATSWIYLLAEGVWMVLLQLCLLKVRYYTRQNPRLKPLSTFEICSVVVILWICYLALAGATRGILGIALAFSEMGQFSEQERHYAGGYGVVFLFYKTLWTWVLHRGVTFGLETVVPLWMASWADSATVLEKIQARGLEVVEFIREIEWKKSPATEIALGKLPAFNERRSCQLISLERHQSDDPVEGARTLSWNIAIDKKALDEMKETLGPPGGFGEMGFNVSREGVSFEAMGIGTRFNLSFSLRKPRNVEQGSQSPKKKRKSL